MRALPARPEIRTFVTMFVLPEVKPGFWRMMRERYPGCDPVDTCDISVLSITLQHAEEEITQ